MKRQFVLAGFFAALAGVLLTGCSGKGGKNGEGDNNATILCTTTIVADVVRQVAGEHQSIGTLMGAGVDPHLYEPTPADTRRTRDAKVIFYSGLHLEGKMTELLENLGGKKPVVALTSKLDPKKLLKDDPHVWFDAELWAQTADVAADTLAAFDPAHADDYRVNAKKYRDKLLALHDEVKKDLAAIPKSQRVLVTAHDAFEYFGRAYDIEVMAIQGVSTESKAGLEKINSLVDVLAERKIKAIFVETSVSDKNVKALREGAGNKGHKVRIGGELYSDALDEPGKPAGSYEGMMRHNVRTIVEALK